MIRFVYFDLDDTLLDHRRAEKAALADCHEHFAAHLNGYSLPHIQETYHAHNVPLWRDYGQGLITKADLQERRFSNLLAALDVEALAPELLGDFYLSRYAHHWHWIEGAERAFHTIADQLPVGILTNGFKEQQRAKLDRFPVLLERSASIVISEEVGIMKPDPALFTHATKAVDVKPEHILYVGDSLHSDVEGGRNAGWQVAWFRGQDGQRDDVLAFHDWGVLLENVQ